MVIKFPYKICNKAVANNQHAIQCDKCHSWVHIKCNKINLSTYRYLQQCVCAWYCIKCFENIIPFSDISNDELYETNVGMKMTFKALTRKQNFQNQDIIEKLNNAMDNPETEILSSKFFEPHELTPPLKNKESISFFHLNISSLSFHFEEFSTLLSTNYHLIYLVYLNRH